MWKASEIIKVGFLTVAIMFTLGVSASQAHVVTLAHLNTEVDIDPHSDDGMDRWEVDGVDHMFQQWFWFRIGTVGVGGPELSVDTIGLTGEVEALGRFLVLTYENDDLLVEITYTVTGGAPLSGASDVGESFSVTNKTDEDIDFVFFEYADFDLDDTIGGDTAVFLSPTFARQRDGSIIATVSVSEVPDLVEVGFFPSTRNKLTDGDGDDLDDFIGPLTGDTTFAFEWFTTLSRSGTPSSSFVFSKNKTIRVPEPATLVLLGFGLIGVGAFGRRRWAC